MAASILEVRAAGEEEEAAESCRGHGRLRGASFFSRAKLAREGGPGGMLLKGEGSTTSESTVSTAAKIRQGVVFRVTSGNIGFAHLA